MCIEVEMGAAASTTAARTQVSELLNDKNGPKPADASDIQVMLDEMMIAGI